MVCPHWQQYNKHFVQFHFQFEVDFTFNDNKVKNVWKITSIQKLVDQLYMRNIKSAFNILAMFSSSIFEEAYLNSHKTNDLKSLHVEMYAG